MSASAALAHQCFAYVSVCLSRHVWPSTRLQLLRIPLPLVSTSHGHTLINTHSVSVWHIHTHLCAVTVHTHAHTLTYAIYHPPPNPSQDTLCAWVCFKSCSPYAIRALLLHSVGQPVFAKCRGKGCQMCTHWNSTPATQRKQAARESCTSSRLLTSTPLSTPPLSSPLTAGPQPSGDGSPWTPSWRTLHWALACGNTNPFGCSLNHYLRGHISVTEVSQPGYNLQGQDKIHHAESWTLSPSRRT